jgi:hypothetical protein
MERDAMRIGVLKMGLEWRARVVTRSVMPQAQLKETQHDTTVM